MKNERVVRDSVINRDLIIPQGDDKLGTPNPKYAKQEEKTIIEFLQKRDEMEYSE